MSKYIDADKLIAEIKGLQCEQGFDTGDAERAYQFAIKDILASIDSLQQEQLLRKSPISWMEETKKELQHEEELLDMRLEALKRIREKKNQFKQEQPDVDLDKELKNKKATLLDDAFGPMNGEQSLAIRNFARYFYELGKIARKEK